MDKNYLNHWVIGIASLVLWCWGDKLGVNADAIKYAALVLPIVVGHAMAFDPNQKAEPAPASSPASTQQ